MVCRGREIVQPRQLAPFLHGSREVAPVALGRWTLLFAVLSVLACGGGSETGEESGEVAGTPEVLETTDDGETPESRAARAPREVTFARALWVVRHDVATPAGVVEVVERATRLGCTDLLVQVRGRGDAYYTSRLSPAAEDLTSGFDALESILSLARPDGIRVHAWVNVLLTWSAPVMPASRHHLVHRHPDWFVTLELHDGRRLPSLRASREELDRLGIEGHYLSPGHPEVVSHLVAVVEEIAGGYGIHGLHLDYVRFPTDQLDGEPAEVTELIQRLAAAARAARPGLIVSAAVSPDPRLARTRKGQEWDAWIAGGELDVALPMCYGGSRQAMLDEMGAARRVAGRLWAGVALYNKPLDVALLGIEAAHDLGFAGVALFSHAVVRDGGAAGERQLTAALVRLDDE